MALCAVSAGCKPKATTGTTAPSASAVASAAPTSTVDHGELDQQAPSDAPKLAATTIATTVYMLADTGSRKLGYIRLGGIVDREPEPTRGKGCKGQWFRVFPMGYVCSDEATTDLESPL